MYKTIMYKTLSKVNPVYLQEIFSTWNSNYVLRDSENKLQLPKSKTDYLKHSFSYSGASLWKGLPKDLRELKSLAQFRRGIDKLLWTCVM
jgi:hypothetical protein